MCVVASRVVCVSVCMFPSLSVNYLSVVNTGNTSCPFFRVVDRVVLLVLVMLVIWSQKKKKM